MSLERSRHCPSINRKKNEQPGAYWIYCTARNCLSCHGHCRVLSHISTSKVPHESIWSICVRAKQWEVCWLLQKEPWFQQKPFTSRIWVWHGKPVFPFFPSPTLEITSNSSKLLNNINASSNHRSCMHHIFSNSAAMQKVRPACAT